MMSVLAPGLGDDVSLVLVVLRVEDAVRDFSFLQDRRERVALLDRGRADEHRLPALVVVGQLLDHGGKLLALRLVDDVLVVLPDEVLVRGDDDDVELVGGVKLRRLGVGGAGHPR